MFDLSPRRIKTGVTKVKLYYEDDRCRLFLGDARHLDALKNKSVNLCILDAPYGLGYVSGHRQESFEPIISDECFPYSLLHDTLYECQRVMKNKTAIYVFCQFNTYVKLLPLVNEVFTFKNLLVWAKGNWSGADLRGDYAREYENIVFAVKGRHILRGKRPANILSFKRVADLHHPAEKPVPLLSYLISKSSDLGDTILDPMCGIGSSLVAAVKSGRKAIGIDIKEEYLEMARWRVRQLVLPLFEEVEVADHDFELFPGEVV